MIVLRDVYKCWLIDWFVPMYRKQLKLWNYGNTNICYCCWAELCCSLILLNTWRRVSALSTSAAACFSLFVVGTVKHRGRLTKRYETVAVITTCNTTSTCTLLSSALLTFRTRGQSNLTKIASRGAHSPVRGHPRGSKVVPLNSWGRVSY